MVPNVITSLGVASAHRVGQEPRATSLAQKTISAKIAIKSANVRTLRDAVRMTGTAFAKMDGWELTVKMFVLKVFMVNIAWNFVRVHRRNSFVMQPMVVYVVLDSLEPIV